MDYIKCGSLSLLCESTILRSKCLLVISCFLLKSITLLYYTNFLKKCGSVHGRRLKIHGNIPEKQSFEVYLSFSTFESFGCSIIDLIRLANTRNCWQLQAHKDWNMFTNPMYEVLLMKWKQCEVKMMAN